MKKVFMTIICVLFLSTGNIASADPMYTNTLEFQGLGAYANYGDQAPFGPFGDYGSFYGIGLLHYEIDVADGINWNETYDWTMDYYLHGGGKYKLNNQDQSHAFNINETGYGIKLGAFSLASPGNGEKLLTARTFIEPLGNSGSFGPISYMNFGDWDEGVLLLGLSQPIGNLESAVAGIKGEIRINANSVAPVPEPATMLLFGAGLAGLAGTRFRRKK